MNVDLLITIFPLIPFLGVTLSLLVKYSLGRDITVASIILNSGLQLIIGLALIVNFYGREGLYTVVLSEWIHSIILSFDGYRVYFLAAYLTPLTLTFFHYKKLTDFNIRLLFLFYLGGCSGLLVAGDIFNFYIFYEVMIMAAYILIAVNRKYFASIKYMLFGAASSAIFLAGIIMLYASGSYFSYSFIENFGELNPANARLILLFFSIAFFIKAAFFPVSGWVATCHSATNTLISCFLSSFTIFTGIIGLFYFVILPANIIGDQSILTFIGIISMLTILIPSLILFFEPDFKRCIAGSTTFTMGFVGLFLAGGAFYLALLYISIHALYKSFMFLLYDDITAKDEKICGSKLSLTLLIIMVVFTVGVFPAISYFIKYNYIYDFQLFKIASYISMFLVLGSFLKFRYNASDHKTGYLYYLLFPLIITGYYLIFPFRWLHSGRFLLIDLIIIAATLLGCRWIYKKTAFLSCLDTKFIYINISQELLYIVFLFIAQILVTGIL